MTETVADIHTDNKEMDTADTLLSDVTPNDSVSNIDHPNTITPVNSKSQQHKRLHSQVSSVDAPSKLRRTRSVEGKEAAGDSDPVVPVKNISSTVAAAEKCIREQTMV